MHEHGKVILNAAQVATFHQFSEALHKSQNMIEMYDEGAIAYEHNQQRNQIGPFVAVSLVPTGNVKVCPACLQALPFVLRELADMYEELAKALELPEAKAKTKFGV